MNKFHEWFVSLFVVLAFQNCQNNTEYSQYDGTDDHNINERFSRQNIDPDSPTK